jgi:hypothetical protein
LLGLVGSPNRSWFGEKLELATCLARLSIGAQVFIPLLIIHLKLRLVHRNGVLKGAEEAKRRLGEPGTSGVGIIRMARVGWRAFRAHFRGLKYVPGL